MTDPKLQPPADEPQPGQVDATSGTRSSQDMGERTAAGNTPRPHDAETAVRPGQQLGPYLLLDKLGEGGMGAVYKARHTRLNKIVALKVLPANLTRDAAALGRFDREMKAVGALDHPNIVRAMDANEHQGTHYLVMEYVEGRDLQQIVKQDGPLSVPRTAELLRQAAQALAYAHKHGLVHRDIKPSNLFLTNEGQIKILDLGLARLSQEENDGLTNTGTSMGTPDYMAPEQWADTHSADGRSDLYALGCTIFYLLTGRPPFSAEKHKSIVNKMRAHEFEAPPSLSAACPAAPPGLDQLYQRLLVKDVNQRLATAAELVQLLEPFCEVVPDSKPTVKKPLSVADSPVTVTLGSTEKAGHAPPPTKLRKSWKTAVLAVGALILVASTISAIVFSRPSKQPNLPVTGKGWHGWPPEAPPPAIAPFTADEARQHQERWAKYLNVPVEWENSIGMKFVLIPPGEFTMGASDAEAEESLSLPAHKVILPRPVYMGVTEVTQGQYEKVMMKNPSAFSPTGRHSDQVAGMNSSLHPVEQVSWEEAARFSTLLGRKESHKPAYRLPTEAEWEFACRAGTTTRYFFGEDVRALPQAAWFGQNSGERTHIVEEMSANPFGLHDLYGNVAEWMEDWMDPDYYKQFRMQSALDPHGPTVARTERVVRGGTYLNGPTSCTSYFRTALKPESRFGDHGFRVVLSVDAVRKAEGVNGPPIPSVRSDVASQGWHGWPADAPKPAIAPFTEDEAKAYQKAWADYLQVPVEWENSIGMKFVLIPPGEFMMGRDDEADSLINELYGHDQSLAQSEKPAHEVVLTRPYYLSIYEVRRRDFERFRPNHNQGYNAPQIPVGNVSWSDAMAFCEYLTTQEANSGNDSLTSYDLPTEAEWEFACRAGTTSLWYFGDSAARSDQYAWTSKPQSMNPVGLLKPNAFGLYDMLGNSHEWCRDWFSDVAYSSDAQTIAVDPTGPATGTQRVFRGGSSGDVPLACRSTRRDPSDPNVAQDPIGFRIVLSVDAVRRKRGVTGPTIPSRPPTPRDSGDLAPIDFAAERKAAEWVLKTGGRVTLRDMEGKEGPVLEGNLPEGRFTLSNANAGAGPGFSDEGLSCLRSCGNLQFVDFYGNQRVSDAGIAQLKGSRIKMLSVAGCPLVTNQATLSIGDIQGLEQLNLGSRHLTDDCLSALNPLKQLKSVLMEDSGITDQGLTRLAEACPQVRHLAVSGSLNGRRSVRPFEKFLNLDSASFSGDQLEDDSVGMFNAHPKLRELHLGGPLNDETFRRLNGLRQAVMIGFDSRQNEDAVEVSEAAYRETIWPECIEHLQFYGINVSPHDSDLVRFAQLPKLNNLDMDGGRQPHYTPAGIAKFRELRPDVRLHVDGKEYAPTPPLPPIDFAAERKAAEWVLAAKGTVVLEDEAGQPLALENGQLPAGKFVVVKVEVSGKQADETGLAHLAGCRRIRDLRLSQFANLDGMRLREPLAILRVNGSQMSDETLIRAAEVTTLHDVSIYDTKVTDRGLVSLAKAKLAKLEVRSTIITPQGIGDFLAACPSLTWLTTSDLANTDAIKVGAHPNLKQFQCLVVQLTPAAIDDLNKCPKFEELAVVSSGRFPAETCDRILGLKNLRSLALAQYYTTDAIDGSMVRKLIPMSTLTSLYFSINGDDECLRAASEIPSLTSLRIDQHQCTEAGITEFCRERPNVQLTIDGKEYPATPAAK